MLTPRARGAEKRPVGVGSGMNARRYGGLWWFPAFFQRISDDFCIVSDDFSKNPHDFRGSKP